MQKPAAAESTQALLVAISACARVEAASRSVPPKAGSTLRVVAAASRSFQGCRRPRSKPVAAVFRWNDAPVGSKQVLAEEVLSWETSAVQQKSRLGAAASVWRPPRARCGLKP